MVAATGVRPRGLHVRALISCAALLAAATLAPGALASGLVPDPDPGPDPAQPQPDAYGNAPAAPAAAAPTQTVAQTAAPVLPTVHISTPRTQLPSAPAKVHVRPVVVATPAHVSEAASEPPATESTARPSVTPIVVPAPIHTRPSAKKRPRPAVVGRVPRQAAHHARATEPQAPAISFARSVLELRWWHAVPAPSVVEVVRPRQVSPGVALAVAAVVLLSGSFLVVAARQVRQP